MSPRESTRRGAVLVLALVVIVVATAVGQLAMVAALHAMRRVESQQSALREALARDALRARIDEQLRSVALASLLGRTIPLNADTTWRLEAGASGWFRLDALVGARVIVSALTTTAPWSGPCTAALISGVLRGDSTAVVADDSVSCPGITRVGPVAYDSIDALWRQQVVHPYDGDDAVLDASTPESAVLVGAGGTIRVSAGS
jgi:hypothetical protein